MRKKLLSLVLSVLVLNTAVSMTHAYGYVKTTVSKSKVVTSTANIKIIESSGLTTSEAAARANIVDYLKALSANRNFSGQVLVEKNGKVLIDRAYGYADYENKKRAKTSTTFCIGSVTKQFTAASIAQLADKGKLAYTDKVSKYLKDVPFGDKITLHQLLTHTSGLYNYTNDPGFLKLDPTKITFEKLIALIKDKPLDFEPGKEWSYSNTNYLILGKIVEKVSGKTLQKYFNDNIFKPVGMNSTKVSYSAKKKLVGANGYSGYIDVKLDTNDEILLNAAYGAGYLCSTAEDMLKWDRALLSGKVVSSKQLNNIFGKHAKMQGEEYYGYGWMISENENGKVIAHGGNTIGFTAENGMYIDRKIKVIILVNKGYANLSDIENNIIKLIDGKEINKVERYNNYSITAKQMDKFIGTYAIGELSLVIQKDSDKLNATFPGMSCIIYPLSESRFYTKDIECEIEFQIDAEGKVPSVKLTISGQTIALTKQEAKDYKKLTIEQLNKYVGDYEIKGIINISVKVKDGKLILQGTGQQEFEVKPISETQFEAQNVGIKVEFNDKDNPDSFKLYQQGMVFTAQKIKNK